MTAVTATARRGPSVAEGRTKRRRGMKGDGPAGGAPGAPGGCRRPRRRTEVCGFARPWRWIPGSPQPGPTQASPGPAASLFVADSRSARPSSLIGRVPGALTPVLVTVLSRGPLSHPRPPHGGDARGGRPGPRGTQAPRPPAESPLQATKRGPPESRGPRGRSNLRARQA